MKLSQYSSNNFERGRPLIVEVCWIVLQAVFISSWIPGSKHRCFLLWLFGAEIGYGVVIKPGFKVKFPWKLRVGSFSWIGEQVWIDNIVDVHIAANCCISQGAYICSGSHNWSRDSFDLITRPIKIEEGAWLCAFSRLGPGVVVGAKAVLKFGSTAYYNLEPGGIYQGCPAELVGLRKTAHSHDVIQLSSVS